MRFKISVLFTIIIFVLFCNLKLEANNNQGGSIITTKKKYASMIGSEYVISALNQLGIEVDDCYQELIREKVLPYATNQSVVVIPKFVIDEDYIFVLDAYILVMDRNTKRIIHQYYEKEAWASDAIMLTDIIIDTAPYKLNSSTRAFGIKTTYNGSSRVNPYSEDLISLFIPQDKNLVKVLNNYPIEKHSGEWDGRCDGSFLSEKTIFMMSKKKTNGFYGIITQTSSTTTTTKWVNDDCNNEEEKVNKTNTLYFKDGEYRF